MVFIQPKDLGLANPKFSLTGLRRANEVNLLHKQRVGQTLACLTTDAPSGNKQLYYFPFLSQKPRS